MKAMLVELLTSKKFMTALAAIVVYVAGRFGLAVDPATLDHIFAALLVYIGGQGLADIGKSAAVVKAAAGPEAPTTTVNVSTPAPAPPPDVHTRETSPGTVSGTIGTLAMLILGAGLALQPGCAETKEYAKAGKVAVIDCGKEYAGPLLAAVARYGALAVANGRVDWDAVEKDALALGKEVGSCAVAAFLEGIRKSPEPQVAASGAVTDVVVQGQAVLARVSGGAEVRLP